MQVHIKMPEFDRAGKRQRFCQQCGRCHLLDAFDQGKRSCRAQLAKHNARCVTSAAAPVSCLSYVEAWQSRRW